MIEFIYYILSRIVPDIKPYDVERKTGNLYLEKENLALIFDTNIKGYLDTDNVVLIHNKDEAPNTSHMNYYVDDIVFDEAIRILRDVGIELSEITPVDYAFAKNVYEDAKKYWDNKHVDGIIEYLSEADNNFYLPSGYKGLNLKNWFEMQCDMFCIEYIYNNRICKIVNSTFAWGDWGLYYSAVRKYMAVNNLDTIRRDAEFAGLKIGSWISDQRTAYKQGYMPLERFNLFKEANISMNIYDDTWNDKYELLKEYKEEYGHTNIEKRQEYKGVTLGLWCQNQRDNYKTGERFISEEQIQLLTDIGFDWNPLETEWNRRYEQYRRYIKENDGDPYIPRRRDFEGEHLGAWVETQRKMMVRGKISSERLKKLGLINPEFNGAQCNP